MKTTKVKKITANGTSNDQEFGVFYHFDYEFEDGTILSARHKSTPSPFKEGDVVEYEIKGTNQQGDYGRVIKPQQRTQQRTQQKPQGDNVQDYIIRQSSLTRSLEFLTNQKHDYTKEHVTQLADYFFKWVKEVKVIPQPTEVLKANPQPSYTPGFEPANAEQSPPLESFDHGMTKEEIEEDNSIPF